MLRLASQSEAQRFAISCDVLVKDPGQTVFRQPLTTQHPKYRLFKNQGPEKLELMQIAYSGISQTQFEQAIGAFKRDLRAGTDIHDS